MSTWLTGTIVAIIDNGTFDVSVERRGGPYASGLGATERVKMVNNEVSALRPQFLPASYGPSSLIGKRIHCEIHSRSPMGYYVVTAKPL